MNFNDNDEVTPFICGTVLKGGSFVRKLRMLRCDLFSILSICHSQMLISHMKQARAIKKGVIGMVQDT